MNFDRRPAPRKVEQLNLKEHFDWAVDTLKWMNLQVYEPSFGGGDVQREGYKKLPTHHQHSILERDREEAVTTLLAMAQAGYQVGGACYHLGLMACHKLDMDLGRSFFAQGASDGSPYCQLALAKHYLDINWIPLDETYAPGHDSYNRQVGVTLLRLASDTLLKSDDQEGIDKARLIANDYKVTDAEGGHPIPVYLDIKPTPP
jgi:hypothetical protein